MSADTREKINWANVKTVARTDLKQLIQAKDFWIPMSLLGSFFFVIIPAILLVTITKIGSVDVVANISQTLEVLPASARDQIRGDTPGGQTGYALAVFLFAPVAVIVPLTISTAVGAATIVGERERGFGAYSLSVNLTVGPEVGGWFFPTQQWWIMILWVLPPFLAICLSLVLRLSARVRSTAAAQQASGLVSLPLIMIAYSQSTGVLFGAGHLSIYLGAVAWAIAIFSLNRGVRSVTRSRLLGVAAGI